MGGHENSGSWRLACVGAIVALAVLGLALLAGCGGSESSDADTAAAPTRTATEAEADSFETSAEATGELAENEKGKTGPVYHLRIYESEIPIEQKVGKPALMRLAFKNQGRRTAPALAITLTIAGDEGDAASQPFGVRPPGEAEKQVWAPLEGYPLVAGSSRQGVLSDAQQKTFAFGPLKPKQVKETRWELRPLETGSYTLEYKASGDLSDDSTTESPFKGFAPSGTFSVEIKAGE